MWKRNTSWLTLLVIVVVVVAVAAIGMLLGDTGKEAPGQTAGPSPSAPSNGGVGGGTGNGGQNGSGSQQPGDFDVPGHAQRVTISYVHDGDTLFLFAQQRGSQIDTTQRIKVRLIGIDTPEITKPAECYGPQATERLRELLPEGSPGWATVDRERQDHYDRWLLYLWTDDGLFVNHAMVADGYAEAIRVRPNDAYWPELSAAEAQAESLGLGMWGAC